MHTPSLFALVSTALLTLSACESATPSGSGLPEHDESGRLAGDLVPEVVPGPGDWSAALPSAPAHTDHSSTAEMPSVMLDEGGNATLVWKHNDDFGDRVAVLSNRYRVNRGFENVRTVPDTNHWVDGLVSAANSDGSGFAAWRNPRSNEVLVARYESEVGWLEPIAVDALPGQQGIYIGAPALAVSDDGYGLLAWQSRDAAGNSLLRASVYVPGEGWGSATVLASGPVTYFPRVAIGAAGHAIVAWSAFVGDQIELFERRYDAASTWAPVRTIARLPDSAGRYGLDELQLVMDGGGTATAIWMHDDDSGSAMVSSSQAPPAQAWPLASVIHGAQYAIEIGWYAPPKLATHPSGHMLLVWREPLEETSRVVARHRSPNGDWGDVTVVADDLAAPYFGCIETDGHHFDAAVDRHGNAVVVWEEKVGTWQLRIQGTHYTRAHGWEPATMLDQDSAFSSRPRVALDREGNGFAYWLQSEDQGMTSGSRLYLSHLHRQSETHDGH